MKSTISLLGKLFSFFILLIFFYSCNNNEQKTSELKKYSEYNDLEKTNLNGDVICFQNYGGDFFNFINNSGNIDKTYFDVDGLKSFTSYLYSNNKLINILHFGENSDNSIFSFNEIFEYDSNFNKKSRITSYSSGINPNGEYFNYDSNGFPNETIDAITGIVTSKQFWSNGKIDSTYSYDDSKIIFKEYYEDGKRIKFLSFNRNGSLDKKHCRDYVYILDSYNNDIKYISTSYLGVKDSSERIILYKGDDLSKYIEEFEKIVTEITNTGNRAFDKMQDNLGGNSINSNQDNTRSDDIKQWVNCSHCHGTGIEECTTCYGKGKMQCGNCNGTGIWGYNNTRCVGCGGKGEVRCDYCYGKGNKGNCRYCYGKGQILE